MPRNRLTGPEAEGVKEALRAIRQGIGKSGYELVKETTTGVRVALVEHDGGRYVVEGNVRLQVFKASDEETFDSVADEFAPAKTCVKCGVQFRGSKFNPKLDTCPACRVSRRKDLRKTGSEDRKVKCSTCGEEFVVSKFHPYRDPKDCPSCTAKAARKRQRDAKKARAST